MARVTSIHRAPRITGKTTLKDWQDTIHKMVIKDRIQRAYANHANEMMALKKFKREHGYCGGSPSCLEFTGGDTRLCARCKKAESNPRSKRPVYEYGKIRSTERKKEREEQAKEATKPEKREPVKRKKAA